MHHAGPRSSHAGAALLLCLALCPAAGCKDTGAEQAADATSSEPVPTTTTGEVVHLSADARELGARFAQNKKKARLLMILSPT